MSERVPVRVSEVLCGSVRGSVGLLGSLCLWGSVKVCAGLLVSL